MQRAALHFLKNWRERRARKPLLLRGARQVGKTWLVREFGKSFSSFIEFNLEAQPEIHDYFIKHFGKPIELIRLLEAESGTKIIPGQSLLFLDEIQDCKQAILALRYFKEELPALHVIAAGSLIEFALKELSFPVGRIETMHVFPLSFSEFLEVRGKAALCDFIADVLHNKEMNPRSHAMIMDELRTYMLIGGMPEVVSTYLNDSNLEEAQRVQQQLAANFRADFNKYASRAKVPYLRKIFDEAPRLLGGKFVYAHISQDIKSRDLAEATTLLEEAGIIYRCYHSSGNGVPLSAEVSARKFKVFFVDIGLANRILGLRLTHELVRDPLQIINRGGLTEQFVAQQLVSLTAADSVPALYFWHREEKSSKAEVDFLWEQNQKIVPIEVKAGESAKIKSLRIFLQEKNIERGVCFSAKPFVKSGKETSSVLNLPLYVTSFLNALT